MHPVDAIRSARLRPVLLAGAALRGIYSETALAAEAGLGRDTLQKWWRSPAVPSTDALHRLAQVVGLPVARLIDLATNPAAPLPSLNWPEGDLAGRVADLELAVAELRLAARQPG